MEKVLQNLIYIVFINFIQCIQTLSGKSTNKLLSWSHYQILTQVHDDTARKWYANEALNESWNVRTLQRNVSYQYYYRLLKAHKKELVNIKMTN